MDSLRGRTFPLSQAPNSFPISSIGPQYDGAALVPRSQWRMKSRELCVAQTHGLPSLVVLPHLESIHPKWHAGFRRSSTPVSRRDSAHRTIEVDFRPVPDDEPIDGAESHQKKHYLYVRIIPPELFTKETYLPRRYCVQKSQFLRG